MKSILICIATLLIWSGSAVARAPISVVDEYTMKSMGLRYVGSPVIAEGRFTSNTIIFQQPLAHARTAELQATVVTTNLLVPRKLEAGTKLYFAAFPDRWCTYERRNQVCLMFEKDKWSWHEDYRGLDITLPFRAVYAVCCTWESPQQLETIALISTPVFQETTDSRVVYTSVLAIHDVSISTGTLNVQIYCIPGNESERRVSCGIGTGLVDLKHTHLNYSSSTETSIGINYDADGHFFTVTTLSPVENEAPK